MNNCQIILLLSATILLTSCGGAPLPHPSDQTTSATNVGIGQMLILTTTNQIVAIDFTDMASSGNDEGGLYRWRSVDVSGCEISDTGRVSAAYFKIGDNQILKNWRYQPWIKCGDFWSKWSYCGPTSVWVYFHPDRTHASVIPDKDFDTYELKVAEKDKTQKE